MKEYAAGSIARDRVVREVKSANQQEAKEQLKELIRLDSETRRRFLLEPSEFQQQFGEIGDVVDFQPVDQHQLRKELVEGSFVKLSKELSTSKSGLTLLVLAKTLMTRGSADSGDSELPLTTAANWKDLCCGIYKESVEPFATFPLGAVAQSLRNHNVHTRWQRFVFDEVDDGERRHVDLQSLVPVWRRFLNVMENVRNDSAHGAAAEQIAKALGLSHNEIKRPEEFDELSDDPIPVSSDSDDLPRKRIASALESDPQLFRKIHRVTAIELEREIANQFAMDRDAFIADASVLDNDDPASSSDAKSRDYIEALHAIISSGWSEDQLDHVARMFEFGVLAQEQPGTGSQDFRINLIAGEYVFFRQWAHRVQFCRSLWGRYEPSFETSDGDHPPAIADGECKRIILEAGAKLLSDYASCASGVGHIRVQAIRLELNHRGTGNTLLEKVDLPIPPVEVLVEAFFHDTRQAIENSVEEKLPPAFVEMVLIRPHELEALGVQSVAECAKAAADQCYDELDAIMGATAGRIVLEAMKEKLGTGDVFAPPGWSDYFEVPAKEHVMSYAKSDPSRLDLISPRKLLAALRQETMGPHLIPNQCQRDSRITDLAKEVYDELRRHKSLLSAATDSKLELAYSALIGRESRQALIKRYKDLTEENFADLIDDFLHAEPPRLAIRFTTQAPDWVRWRDKEGSARDRIWDRAFRLLKYCLTWRKVGGALIVVFVFCYLYRVSTAEYPQLPNPGWSPVSVSNPNLLSLFKREDTESLFVEAGNVEFRDQTITHYTSRPISMMDKAIQMIPGYWRDDQHELVLTEWQAKEFCTRLQAVWRQKYYAGFPVDDMPHAFFIHPLLPRGALARQLNKEIKVDEQGRFSLEFVICVNTPCLKGNCNCGS